MNICFLLLLFFLPCATSWVGIARYGLDGPGIQARWMRDFFPPARTGRGVHPASRTVGTVSFLGAKRPWFGVNHPPSSSVAIKERVKLCLHSSFGPSWHVTG